MLVIDFKKVKKPQKQKKQTKTKTKQKLVQLHLCINIAGCILDVGLNSSSVWYYWLLQ